MLEDTDTADVFWMTWFLWFMAWIHGSWNSSGFFPAWNMAKERLLAGFFREIVSGLRYTPENYQMFKCPPKKGPFQKEMSSSNHYFSRDIFVFGEVSQVGIEESPAPLPHKMEAIFWAPVCMREKVEDPRYHQHTTALGLEMIELLERWPAWMSQEVSKWLAHGL